MTSSVKKRKEKYKIIAFTIAEHIAALKKEINNNNSCY